ncbi:hypothetical protein Tco_0728713 [Tanacetum coccineum]|uniref:Uncharacterized protein n=1 Tax=Tanacetum coccineum TaxID=301880 RepID=A0ABQ4YPK4_9ASTR
MSRDNKDKDQDPFAGSNRGTKRRKSSKDAESSRDPKSKESKLKSLTRKPEQPSTPDPDWNKRQQVDFRPSQTWISNLARAEKPPTSFDELMDTPIDFSAFVLNRLHITNLTQDLLVGPVFNLIKCTCKIRTELEYHFEECFKATTERLDWHNPEGNKYPFDLRKPLPLILNHRGRHVIPFDYFINNDLEYLKGGSLSRKYLSSITKIKAATYEVQWIEDMARDIWSPVKMSTPENELFIVTSLKIMKRYDYGHLDEIEVRREDHQLYTFKEGDFLRLHLQDIEDMLLLLVQQRLTNLTIDERYDLNVALHMQNLRNRTAYTTYSDPQGVIYEDQNNRNRLMRTDELHKFSDGTLNYVRTALHDISSGIRMDYLQKRKWSNLDKRTARVMIQDIDKQIFQRRLMRNLEKFVGGREYEKDLILLTRRM